MTNQEAFNIIVERMAQQGWMRSYRAERCAYRGENGLVCAIGALIPDAVYRPEMEQESVLYLQEVLPSKISMNLLVDCQVAHDEGDEGEDMKIRFQKVAIRFFLEFPTSLLT